MVNQDDAYACSIVWRILCRFLWSSCVWCQQCSPIVNFCEWMTRPVGNLSVAKVQRMAWGSEPYCLLRPDGNIVTMPKSERERHLVCLDNCVHRQVPGFVQPARPENHFGAAFLCRSVWVFSVKNQIKKVLLSMTLSPKLNCDFLLKMWSTKLLRLAQVTKKRHMAPRVPGTVAYLHVSIFHASALRSQDS